MKQSVFYFRTAKIFNLINVFLFICILLFSCKKKINENEVYRIGIEKCSKHPEFAKKLGSDLNRTAFSTSINNYTGVVLVELDANESKPYRVYQDNSWKKFGHMGALTSGNDGTEFTAQEPVVNTLHGSAFQMNKIFKIDPISGKMDVFCNLPNPDSTTDAVPHAVLGVYYDCHSNRLFASTVAGSTRNTENGAIYSIEPTTGQIKDQIKGIDAMGLFVCGITGEKLLYFGSARNSNIYTIKIDAEGNFDGKPVLAFSLENQGPRGDDKARKLRLTNNNLLEIHGIEFNYSLAANTTRPESIYLFDYISGENKWAFNQGSQ